MTRNSITMVNEFLNLLDDAVNSLLSKEDIDSLTAKKLDDLEQYGRSENLRLNEFQTKDNEFSENCSKMMKEYIRNTLKIKIDDIDFNCIQRIGQKYRGDDRK